MSSHADVLGSAAVVIVVVMVTAWLVSLVRRDAGVADVVWGFGFVASSWVGAGVGDGQPDRSNLLLAMVTIWGLRLTGHLFVRNRGSDEDFRYASMRRRRGPNFAMTSLFTVFGLQGLAMFVVALPLLLAMTPDDPPVGGIAIVGIIVWGVGLFFETVGDAQLVRFRRDPANDGRVLDWGLWRYTRHPNYFGDMCIWWGMFIVAAETADARWGVVGPLLLTFMLVRVTGMAMLERGLRKRRPGYAAYIARTSAFFPRPPKEPAHEPAR